MYIPNNGPAGHILSTTVKKKLRAVIHQQEAFDSICWKYKWWKFSLSYYFVS